MAQSIPAMTPEEALQTVAAVRASRERLTARAAGQVWMVWGFALAVVASADMGALVVDSDVDSVGEGWHMNLGAWPTMLLVVLALVIGGLVTNAVWTAHALERADRHRSWVTWVAILGLMLATVGIGVLTVEVLSRAPADETTADVSFVMIMPLVGALGAGVIAVLQRRRVALWPGVVAALLLVILQLVLPLSLDVANETQVLRAVQLSMLGILAVFVATGLWYHAKG